MKFLADILASGIAIGAIYGPPAAGLSADLQKTLDELYDRLK